MVEEDVNQSAFAPRMDVGMQLSHSSVRGAITRCSYSLSHGGLCFPHPVAWLLFGRYCQRQILPHENRP